MTITKNAIWKVNKLTNEKKIIKKGDESFFDECKKLNEDNVDDNYYYEIATVSKD